jgi:hypothetical protein
MAVNFPSGVNFRSDVGHKPHPAKSTHIELTVYPFFASTNVGASCQVKEGDQSPERETGIDGQSFDESPDGGQSTSHSG